MRLPRQLKRGHRGLDVRGVKHALRRAGVLHPLSLASNKYGRGTERAVRHFQRKNGLAETGRVGQQTWRVLRHFAGTRAKAQIRRYAASHGVRQVMRREMLWGLRNEPQIHYPPGDVRKEANFVPVDEWVAHKLPITLDCSESAVAIAKASGAPDPTNSGYGHHGLMFTGTMLAHAQAKGLFIHQGDLQVGDYVIFGPGTGDHVCSVLGEGADPLLFSHGQDAGPISIRLSVERSFHRMPVRCVSADVGL